MPKHRITAYVPSHKAENVGFVVKVQADGQLLGELLVNQGSTGWRPIYGRKVFRLPWRRSDAVMEERGRVRPR